MGGQGHFKKGRGSQLAACVVLMLFHSISTGIVNSVVLVLVENHTVFHSINGDIFKAL